MLVLRTRCRQVAAVTAGPDQDTGVKSVTGVVVDVRSSSLTTLDLLTARAEDGTLRTFTFTEGFVGITPSHLKEHPAFALPVTVTFEAIEESLGVLLIAG